MADAPARSEPEDRQFVVALARGLEILRCFDAEHRQLGTTEIAARTGLPQPTVWRLAHTLQKLGYLVMESGADKLRLGPAAVALGGAALAGQESLDIARPRMQELADRYQAAVALGRRDGDSIVYLARCQGDSPLLMNLRVGSRIPLYRSAIGWAYLASGAGGERDLALAEAGAPGPEALQAFQDAVDLYDERGFVIHCRPQHHVNTVATAIVVQGNDRYAISCGGPASALPVEAILDEIGPALVKLAAELQPIFLLGRRYA
ncbi:IclR family transcriptional regulator [Pigmentiphaga sp. GD03639]|uniref:IclR family transcriptional regulator n=1 Tax=Pigmentiphaga daeguensis TaxID=414049 RepID=A0ABN1C3M1_9BURK|nr:MULTISPECIES: IclR family transcriptional regulator [unclassified Pigmentiphaga]MDH2239389.1 IclR family transcriptional regulator [Pigmentiphaga sp. GD03639]OVZ65391.1 IclR family transcriptional regulator [Pigmentiphaga sp. NML030171]